MSFGEEIQPIEKKSFAIYQYYIGKSKEGDYVLKMEYALKREKFKYYLKYFTNDHKLQKQVEILNELAQREGTYDLSYENCWWSSNKILQRKISKTIHTMHRMPSMYLSLQKSSLN